MQKKKPTSHGRVECVEFLRKDERRGFSRSVIEFSPRLGNQKRSHTQIKAITTLGTPIALGT